MPPRPQSTLDQAAFETGLHQLSIAIGKSSVLAPFRPIEMIASGGYVSVAYLKNRKASQDLDYFLCASRFGNDYEDVRTELQQLIRVVGQKLSYNSQWANDEVRLFLGLLADPQTLFNQSKAQNVVLYHDASLVIYAVKWEWVLARKLKRLQMEGQPARPEDWKDCIAITKLLYDANEGKLSPTILQLFDNTQRESPVLPKTVANLRRLVLELYQVDTLPVAIWTYTSSIRSFEYRWNNGAKIAQDLWPAFQGRVPVYLVDSKRWRHYDSNRREWDEMPSEHAGRAE